MSTEDEQRRRFGAYLARLRRRVAARRGLPYYTQSDLARETGVTKGTVSAIEGGRVHRPSDATLAKFARALGVSVADLARAAPPKRNASGIGRFAVLSDAIKDEIAWRYDQGETIVELARAYHRARATIVRALRDRGRTPRLGRPRG